MKKTLFLLFLSFLSVFTFSESKMILIPTGKFTMGSPENEKLRNNDEKQHDVTINSFYVDAYEVTQQDYALVMGENPSFNKGDNLPVENVSFYDAIKFCNKKSRLEKLTPCYIISGKDVLWDKRADGYRLLTEAEWEYACRAGRDSVFNTGDWSNPIDFNYDGENPYQIEENYLRRINRNVQTGMVRGKTIAVDSLEPNALGLYNMHGNVAEWVFDFYGQYELRRYVDPYCPLTGIYRVVRGGGFLDSGKNCRSAYRFAVNPKQKQKTIGFRIAKNASERGGEVDTKYDENIDQIIIPQKPKVLIAYFSFTGNTEGAAAKLDEKLKKKYTSANVDCLEIEMSKPYGDDIFEESQKDLMNNVRPRLRTKIDNFEQYDVIFLGYPVWWATLPMPVISFFDKYDFSGKTIFPFVSHSGSEFGASVSELNKILQNSYVGTPYCFYYGGGRELNTELDEWIGTILK